MRLPVIHLVLFWSASVTIFCYLLNKTCFFPSLTPLWLQLSLPLSRSQLGPAKSDRCVKSILHLCHFWQVRSGRAGTLQTWGWHAQRRRYLIKEPYVWRACALEYPRARLHFILPRARCGMMPDMSRDAELHSCWEVNRDPYNPLLLSQHGKPLGTRCEIPASHIFSTSTHWIIYSWIQNPDTMQKPEVDLISEKEILLLSSFAFIRKQVVARSMDQLLKQWYESPEAATRTIHSRGWQSGGRLLQCPSIL